MDNNTEIINNKQKECIELIRENMEHCIEVIKPPDYVNPRKDYSHNYYVKNRKYWFDKKQCEYCNKSYILANTSRHHKTKRHVANVLKKQKQLEEENNKKQIETLNQAFDVIRSLTDQIHFKMT
jgi:hypothetical protein